MVSPMMSDCSRGDITVIDVDAIVNAANESLLGLLLSWFCGPYAEIIVAGGGGGTFPVQHTLKTKPKAMHDL